MFSVFDRVTQRRAERVWHRVEWLQNGFIGVLGVPRPPLVTFGAAALAEFALLPAAEFGLLLADPIFEVSVSKVFDLEPGSVNCDSARKPFFFSSIRWQFSPTGQFTVPIQFSVVPTENSESMEKSGDLSCPTVVSRPCSHSARSFFHGSLAGFAAARNWSSRSLRSATNWQSCIASVPSTPDSQRRLRLGAIVPNKTD